VKLPTICNCLVVRAGKQPSSGPDEGEDPRSDGGQRQSGETRYNSSINIFFKSFSAVVTAPIYSVTD